MSVNYTNPDPACLETFPNPHPGRDYSITISCPEFTSVCPKTGLPDFGTITISYTPQERCLELKALKLYLLAYRNLGAFYEDLTNRLFNDLTKACAPISMTITGSFSSRGGIRTEVVVSSNDFCTD